MPEVNVEINGRRYRMACEDGQEAHLQGLADRFNRSIEDLKLVRVGSKRALEPLFAFSRLPMNSDYFPVVDQNAAKARFMRRRARSK